MTVENVVQEDMTSNYVAMEETNLSSEKGTSELPETVAPAVVKASKAPKAGEKAPLEAIKSWRENGFSRSITLLVNFYL